MTPSGTVTLLVKPPGFECSFRFGPTDTSRSNRGLDIEIDFYQLFDIDDHITYVKVDKRFEALGSPSSSESLVARIEFRLGEFLDVEYGIGFQGRDGSVGKQQDDGGIFACGLDGVTVKENFARLHRCSRKSCPGHIVRYGHSSFHVGYDDRATWI